MYQTARRTHDGDATVHSIHDDIVSDNAVSATEANTVSPLLERINTARADIVVLNDEIGTGERTFGDVKAGPRAWVIQFHAFDLVVIRSVPRTTILAEIAHQLVGVVASHLDVSTSLDRRVATPCPIDLRGAPQPSRRANSPSDKNTP